MGKFCCVVLLAVLAVLKEIKRFVSSTFLWKLLIREFKRGNYRKNVWHHQDARSLFTSLSSRYFAIPIFSLKIIAPVMKEAHLLSPNFIQL